MSIGLRIKELRIKKNISIRDLSKEIGIDPSQFSKIEKDKLKLTIPRVVELSSFFNVSTDYLLTGKSYNTEEKPNIYSLKTDNNIPDQSIPLYNLEATAGVVSLFNDSNDVEPIDYLSIPNLPKCDGALFVTGDSMYPLLKSGDIVAYKQINDFENEIFWGEMYLVSVEVAGDTYTMVKYVQKSEEGKEYIKLVSQNNHHQPKDIHLSKLRAMALVKASVRYNFMK